MEENALRVRKRYKSCMSSVEVVDESLMVISPTTSIASQNLEIFEAIEGIFPKKEQKVTMRKAIKT